MNSTLRMTGSIGGVSIQATIVRTAEGQIGQDVELPAAKAGTLSTRTDDNTGVAAMSNGHGIQTNDVVDVYWADGVRYGMTATVSGNNVTVDGGSGDVLPAQGTALTVCVEVEINLDVDGDDIEMIAVSATKRSHLVFQTSAPADLLALEIPANEGWEWFSGGPVSNPLTGNPIDRVVASNGDSTAASTLKIGLLYNSA